MRLAYDDRKFTEVVLHGARRLRDDRAGGATKLNKVLFFAEFTHLRRHHSVISGCEFQKLAHGPAPRQLLPVREQLIANGDAELVAEDFLGRPQHRLLYIGDSGILHALLDLPDQVSLERHPILGPSWEGSCSAKSGPRPGAGPISATSRPPTAAPNWICSSSMATHALMHRKHRRLLAILGQFYQSFSGTSTSHPRA